MMDDVDILYWTVTIYSGVIFHGATAASLISICDLEESRLDVRHTFVISPMPVWTTSKPCTCQQCLYVHFGVTRVRYFPRFTQIFHNKHSVRCA